MQKVIALNEFIIQQQQTDYPAAGGNFSRLLHHIGIAAKNAKRWGSAIEAFKRARERSSSESMRSESLTHIKSCREKLK